MMRGKNFKESRKHPVSEIYVDFRFPVDKVDKLDGYKSIDGYIHFGGSKFTPKEVGLALEDFAKFLQDLPDETDYADYDEGDMCCGL
jgi:hypothetical protein